MEINLYLLLSLLIALLVISYLLGKLHRVRGQLFLIRDALNDIKAGNLNRRVLVRESDLTKQICYDINEIAMSSQSRLIQQKQSEQAYKRLMTSLSHDVKTPLASLVGYLEAVESKMVTGAEKEEYIRVAMEKAHHLKDFVTALFEWVKLDAGEQIFHFEVCDLNELSRDIMADWVPLLENHDLSYEIEIPETEYMTRVDSTAYTRILNNLLQNILTHSDASKVFLTVTETEQQVKIVVADNGNGIAASDLPHIFERMYQCDHSRSAKGNGLGLSIAKELVSIHKGTITAASVPGNGTTFIIRACSISRSSPFMDSFGDLYTLAFKNLSSLFLPIVLGMFATTLFFDEHKNDTMKELLIIPITKAQLYFSKVAVVILMSVGLCLITFLLCVVGGLIAGGFPDLNAQTLMDAGLLYLAGGILIPIAMLPIVFLSTLSKGYILPIGATLLYLIPVVIAPAYLTGIHPLASVMGIYPHISEAAAAMVESLMQGVLFNTSPLVCVGSLLLIGATFAAASVVALKKQSY